MCSSGNETKNIYGRHPDDPVYPVTEQVVYPADEYPLAAFRQSPSATMLRCECTPEEFRRIVDFVCRDLQLDKAAVETVHKRGGLNSLWEIRAFAGDTKVVWASLFRAVSWYSPEGLVILRKFCDRPRCD